MIEKADFELTKGDTYPPLVLTLVRAENNTVTVVDLTDVVSVQFVMTAPDGSALVNGTGEVIDAANGKVQYKFAAGETDVVGTCYGKFYANWDDAGTPRRESFPSFRPMTIRFDEEPPVPA